MVTSTIDGSREVRGSRTAAGASHPRLIPVEQLRQRVQPLGWSTNDTLFVVLLCIAVALCSLIPLALI